MSDHGTGVLDDDQSTNKSSKQVDELKHEQDLVVAQNTLYFNTIGLKNSTRDQDKVSKSRGNKSKLESYSKEQEGSRNKRSRTSDFRLSTRTCC